MYSPRVDTVHVAATIRAQPRANPSRDETTILVASPLDLEGRLIVDSVHARLFGAADERATRIGKYIVLRRIGGGAMSDVFLGWHEDLERNDAIKLVRADARDVEVDRKRLLREAQALARLDHDNVIRVYDSGTHHGRVYIAMEYVKGMTLGTWQKGKPWREVLAAYVKAGRGLQAAHAVVLDAGDRPGAAPTSGPSAARHGLVHRDFKPDNVLVGDDGRVRVADFGLAVPLDRAELASAGVSVARPIDVRLTRSDVIMGTPLYIAPEQLAGRAPDARCDQFSFCVALYEALYRQHPYYAPGAHGRDSREATGTGGLAPTDSLLPLFDALLRAPLRTPPAGAAPRRIFQVLARGLDRDPERRYASMAELLADLERDPRRRTLWSFGTIAAMGLAAGLTYNATRPGEYCVGVADEVADVWDAARREQVRAAFVATGVPHAERSFAAAHRALQGYLGAWTASRRSACVMHQRRVLDDELHRRSMACLDHRAAQARLAVDELRRVDADTIGDALERIESLPRIGDCDDRVILGQTCTVVPDDPASADARAAIQTARAAELSGRYQDAEPLAAAAVAAAEVLKTTPSLAAEAHHLHGRILTELSRPAAARGALLSAFAYAEQADCDVLAADIATRVVKLVALNPELDAQIGVDWSDFTFAKLGQIPDDVLRRADALGDRGLLNERRMGDLAAAERDYRDALSLREREPAESVAARAINHLNLGSVLARQERPDEAVAALERSLALYGEAYGDQNPQSGWKPLFNLGVVFTESGRYDLAEDALRRARTYATVAFGPENRKVLEVQNALVALHLDRNDPERHDGERACVLAAEALAVCERIAPRGESLCLDLRRELAHGLELLDRSEEALALRQQVLATMLLERDPAIGDAHLELAQSLATLERWEQVHEQTKAALPAIGTAPNDLRVADVSLLHGEALLHLGRPADAVPFLQRALDRWQRGADGARATAQWALARALCVAGVDVSDARSLARQARESFESLPNSDSGELVAKIDTWQRKPCRTTRNR